MPLVKKNGYNIDARRGKTLKAVSFRHANDALRRLKVGAGLRLDHVGDFVVLDTRGNNTAGGSTGGKTGLAGSQPYWHGTVTALPAVPNSGYAECYWTSSGGGTGDNQIWRVHASQTAWTPTQKSSTKSGTPV